MKIERIDLSPLIRIPVYFRGPIEASKQQNGGSGRGESLIGRIIRNVNLLKPNNFRWTWPNSWFVVSRFSEEGRSWKPSRELQFNLIKRKPSFLLCTIIRE